MEESNSFVVILLAVYGLGLSSPLWLPIAFLAYWIGRRRFSLRLPFVLVTLEAFALGAVIWFVSRVGGFVPVY